MGKQQIRTASTNTHPKATRDNQSQPSGIDKQKLKQFNQTKTAYKQHTYK
jgi:hypothetical protein